MTTIKGTNSTETKTGTTSADLIYGYGGNDSLYGRAGNDTIWGGLGDDKLWGEAGDDTLRGEDGTDTIYAGDGNDLAYGGIGNDTLYGDGGTDRMYGDAGNDILKGGTGIAKLYGGDGNDQLYYDPTTSTLSAVKQYFAGSLLNGDGGTDKLHLFNKAVATSDESGYYTPGAAKPSDTSIYVDNSGGGHMSFYDAPSWWGETIDVGTFSGIEEVAYTGAGRLDFRFSDTGAGPHKVTGGVSHDTFTSYKGSDTMVGGAGNDTFHIGGNNDTVISEINDSDSFYFTNLFNTNATVVGFNGAGDDSGDRIYVDDHYLTNPGNQIHEAGGVTTFKVTAEDYFVVKAVGLVEDVDYFFV